MGQHIHLIVESGKNSGRTIAVPPQGTTLGRSSRNDIVLADPLLSRRHCKFLFKANGRLWISDLGSANNTLLNGKFVREAELSTGDIVTIGATRLRVINTSASPDTAGTKDLNHLASDMNVPGRDPTLTNRDKPSRRVLRWVWIELPVFILIAAAVWFVKIRPNRGPTDPSAPPPAKPAAVEIEYEKVHATSGNIFRYSLELSRNQVLTVRIDDAQNDRHVRKESKVDDRVIEDLARSILNSGFFALAEDYQSVQTDRLDQWDISVTIGPQTHRARVVGRIEPDTFQAVRESLELFGKNELGLWALQFSKEKLVEMAQQSLLLGRKLSTDRDIKHGNLASALKHFMEADGYLETVAPKPSFYPDILEGIKECDRDIQTRYEDRALQAERAILQRDWEAAARELQILCETIPERRDFRNKEARKKLIDVERHLARGK